MLEQHRDKNNYKESPNAANQKKKKKVFIGQPGVETSENEKRKTGFSIGNCTLQVRSSGEEDMGSVNVSSFIKKASVGEEFRFS